MGRMVRATQSLGMNIVDKGNCCIVATKKPITTPEDYRQLCREISHQPDAEDRRRCSCGDFCCRERKLRLVAINELNEFFDIFEIEYDNNDVCDNEGNDFSPIVIFAFFGSIICGQWIMPEEGGALCPCIVWDDFKKCPKVDCVSLNKQETGFMFFAACEKSVNDNK